MAKAKTDPLGYGTPTGLPASTAQNYGTPSSRTMTGGGGSGHEGSFGGGQSTSQAPSGGSSVAGSIRDKINGALDGYQSPTTKQNSGSGNSYQEPGGGNGGNLYDIAKDVKNGAYGNGQDRRDALIAAGYDPDEVQNIVNGMYGGSGGGGSSSRANSGYTSPTLPTATSQADYINAMYEASQRATEEALRGAYEKNVGALDYQQGKLAPTYDAAANNAGAQAAIQRANFNESAAASGLNTGAGSQAELSMRNAEAANISAIRKAQADAQADLDYQRSQLTLEYQNAIREAIAKNELEKAQALYEEAKRVDESLVSTAINQANLDWNIWKYNR